MQPFSTGPREWLGQNLAWAEMRLVLAYLIWEFDLVAMGKSKNILKKPLLLQLNSRHDEASA